MEPGPRIIRSKDQYDILLTEPKLQSDDRIDRRGALGARIIRRTVRISDLGRELWEAAHVRGDLGRSTNRRPAADAHGQPLDVQSDGSGSSADDDPSRFSTFTSRCGCTSPSRSRPRWSAGSRRSSRSSMMFYPVEFKGIRPFLGWQGQIPKRAAKMAGIAVDSVTSRGADAGGAVRSDRSRRAGRELEGPLHDATEEIVEEIMTEYQPRLWAAMPSRCQARGHRQRRARAPAATRNLMSQLRRNLDQVFDLKHMVVSNLVRDKRLLNRHVPGDRRGLVPVPHPVRPVLRLLHRLGPGGRVRDHRIGLVLPLFGLITGGLTDYIALTMIFRPRRRSGSRPGSSGRACSTSRRAEGDAQTTARCLPRTSSLPPRSWTACSPGRCRTSSSGSSEDEIQKTIDEQTGVARHLITSPSVRASTTR